MSNLLEQLISRGDKVSIKKGRLNIQAASGLEVPKRWLRIKNEELVTEIAKKLELPILLYTGYKTGKFASGIYEGIRLTYRELNSGELYPAYYNVSLTRKRNSKNHKSSEPYKDNQFRLEKNSLFRRHWIKYDLPMPQNNTKFHEYMGHLRFVVIKAQLKNDEKIINNSIELIEVTYEELLSKMGYSSTKELPNPYENMINKLPSATTKGNNINQVMEGANVELNSGGFECEERFRQKEVNKLIDIAEQSNEEWLADYERGLTLRNSKGGR